MAHPTDPIDYPIVTPRLLLRPFDAERDVTPMAAYRGREDVLAHTPIPTSTPEQIADRLTEEGDILSLAVEHRESGEMIGDVVLFWHSETNRHGELGWTITPERQGNGFAREAARALGDLAFQHLGLRRLTALIDARHTTSQALARSLGMREEARRVEAVLMKGEWGHRDRMGGAGPRVEVRQRLTRVLNRRLRCAGA